MTETVPAGRFVPAIPSQEMIQVGKEADLTENVRGASVEHRISRIYRAMVAAAPALPTAEADQLRAALYALRQRAADDVNDGPSGAAMQARALNAFEWLGDVIEAFVDERVSDAALATTTETASLHDSSIVEGSIKLPSNSPETAKPDTSAADIEEAAKVIYAAMRWAREQQPGEKAPAWVEGGNSDAQYHARSAARVIAALHPAPATASSGGMAEAAAVLADLKAGVFYNIDGSPRRVLDRLQLPDRAASTIEALSKQVADYARDAYQCGQRLADMEARAEAAEAALAEQSRRKAMDGISLEVATALVELFGGDDTDMTIQFIAGGHSGPGFYAWCTEYPEDGSSFLGPDFNELEALRLASEDAARAARGDDANG